MRTRKQIEMHQIKLRFSQQIWIQLLSMLTTDPATKVFINFEEGTMHTSFLFLQNEEETTWQGYLTGLNNVSKFAPHDENNMTHYELNEYHIFEIEDIMEDDSEPVLYYLPAKMYANELEYEKLTLEGKDNNKWNHQN